MSTLTTLPSLRLLIVEDDPVMRLGLEQFFEDYPQLQILGLVGDGYSAIEQALALQPDLVIMDIGLPQLDGIVATQKIKTKLPSVRVVMLTSHTTENEMIAALSSGADAYCVKGTNLEQLLVAIASAHEGATYLDPQIARRIIDHLSPIPAANPPSSIRQPSDAAPIYPLSERELDVLKLIVEGQSNPEIATTLHLSLSTVKTHIRSIMNKLAVDDRVQAAVVALRSGLV